MNVQRAGRLRASSDQSEQGPHYHPENPRLTRARSQDFSVVESIAVPDDPTEESDSTLDDVSDIEGITWPRSARYLVLICAFLISLSFGVTQVPLLYVFRLMTCDAYYEEHGQNISTAPFPTGSTFWHASSRSQTLIFEEKSDRCSLNAIESSTALSISLLGASTTVFGIQIGRAHV